VTELYVYNKHLVVTNGLSTQSL